MARIPTYTAQNLASERVGVPQQDQSGVIIANSITGLASKAANVIGEVVERQNTLLRRAEISKKISQFDSDMLIASTEIRQKHMTTPDEGIKELNTRRQEIFDTYKEGITDPELKMTFDAAGSETLFKGKALDQVWAFGQKNQLIQKDHFDRIAGDVAFAGQTDNFAEVIEKASALDRDREDFYGAWGSIGEGEKVIQQGQESLVKSYFYGQLDKGNAFKVLKEIEAGQLGPTEGTNGLIEPMQLKGLKNIAMKMATLGKDDAAAFALVDAVQSNFDIDNALRQPISQTEENINSLSFLIGQKKELAAVGEVNEEEIKTLEQQQVMLEKVRAAQMSRNDMYIVPDAEIDAEMTSRFFGLFPKGNTRKPFKAKLDEVFKFQQDLMDNRDRMTPANFKKLNLMAQKSFNDEIEGFKKSKLRTQKSWGGLGPMEAADKNKLSQSKKLQNIFSDLIKTHDPAAGNKDLFETMQMFYDDLDEVLDLNDAPAFEAMNQQSLDVLMTGAKRKMQLKKMGLPIYLGEKNVIYHDGVPHEIKGFYPDGMPDVEPLE